MAEREEIAVIRAEIYLEPLGNKREHHMVKHRRARREQGNAAMVLAASGKVRLLKASMPLHVELVRIAPRRLDPDNLAASWKHYQDGIAQVLNVDDGDKSLVSWSYSQERGEPREYGIRIVFSRGTL